jgi:2-polyprenyl-3-methyl-5-hydroxy-6-metoxy-1,4-benzoquinol methylase
MNNSEETVVLKPIKKVVHRFGAWYNREVCRREYESQDWKVNERPVEFRFVFDQLAQLNARSVLDVGTGTTALPHVMRTCGYLVTAVDNVRDYWPNGASNRHYHVLDDDIRNSSLQQTFDVVTCISVLEHIVDHQAAVRSMCRLLNPGGHLLMTFPYNEARYYPNAYALPESDPVFRNLPFVCQIYSRREVAEWVNSNRMAIATEEYWSVYTADLWTCGSNIVPPRKVSVDDKHHLMCLAMRKDSSA